MKLYLSSYKLGNRIDYLEEWIKTHNNKIVLIPNSRDVFEDSERLRTGINKDKEMLESIGFEVTIISLKQYFGNYDKLKEDLSKYNAFFAIGGNTFCLRKAYELSGFDNFLKENIDNEEFLYGGYSAGICVLAESLEGLDLVDEMINPYNSDSLDYKGVGIIDYTPVPHYKSDHPESELVDKCVEYSLSKNLNIKTLRDGDVIIESTSKNLVK